jgi:hypothetical protein
LTDRPNGTTKIDYNDTGLTTDPGFDIWPSRPKEADAMEQGLTEWAQASRLTVVEVMKEAGAIRVRDAADQCTQISCGPGTTIAADDVDPGGLETLGAGDIIRIDERPGGARRIMVVRRSWDEITSPEF